MESLTKDSNRATIVALYSLFGFWGTHKSLFSYFGSSEAVDDEAFWYQGYDEQFASLPRKILVVAVQKNMR